MLGFNSCGAFLYGFQVFLNSSRYFPAVDWYTFTAWNQLKLVIAIRKNVQSIVLIFQDGKIVVKRFESGIFFSLKDKLE